MAFSSLLIASSDHITFDITAIQLFLASAQHTGVGIDLVIQAACAQGENLRMQGSISTGSVSMATIGIVESCVHIKFSDY